MHLRIKCFLRMSLSIHIWKIDLQGGILSRNFFEETVRVHEYHVTYVRTGRMTHTGRELMDGELQSTASSKLLPKWSSNDVSENCFLEVVCEKQRDILTPRTLSPPAVKIFESKLLRQWNHQLQLERARRDIPIQIIRDHMLRLLSHDLIMWPMPSVYAISLAQEFIWIWGIFPI